MNYSPPGATAELLGFFFFLVGGCWNAKNVQYPRRDSNPEPLQYAPSVLPLHTEGMLERGRK
ncbi:hypothetical protein X975_19560, partial [Stegodyphus mimosarum]